MKIRQSCMRASCFAALALLFAGGLEAGWGSRSSKVPWIWSGGITATSARVHAKVRRPDAEIALVYGPADLSDSRIRAQPSRIVTEAGVLQFQLRNLASGTAYSYALEVDGRMTEAHQGSFSTFPEAPASFQIAFGNCARTGSESSVFSTIARHEPVIFLHLGDFHYENISRPKKARTAGPMIACCARSPSLRSIAGYRSLTSGTITTSGEIMQTARIRAGRPPDKPTGTSCLIILCRQETETRRSTKAFRSDGCAFY